MENTWPESFLHSRQSVWMVAAIGLLLFLVTNLPWQLDDYDQAKQAYTSFEMVKEGHWVYQHTPHERVATKPPLVGWISAAVFEVSRSWGLAWRLPSFAAALALGVILFRKSGNAYGAAAALLAVSAFAFNLLSPRLATLVRTDMPLALVIFLIGLLIWEKIRANQPWNGRDRWWMFLLLTGGMLIKGPIVYAFLLPGLFAFQFWRRKTAAASAWFGWWPWLASLVIFGIWVAGGIKFVPDFYDQVVQKEFLGRFGETMHRPQPFYFYWPHLLHKFAPWSVLLVVLAIELVRTGRQEDPPRRVNSGQKTEDSTARTWWRRINPEVFWLAAWALGGLIVMSIIPSKRVDRIFPVIPPLCLLLAAQVGACFANPSLRRRTALVSVLGVLFAIVFTGTYSIYKVAAGYREKRDALAQFGREVRTEAATHGWKFGAVAGKDEGMILYLDQSHFTAPEHAGVEWKSGRINALVVPAEESGTYLKELVGATVSALQSGERKDERGNYVLLIRED